MNIEVLGVIFGDASEAEHELASKQDRMNQLRTDKASLERRSEELQKKCQAQLALEQECKRFEEETRRKKSEHDTVNAEVLRLQGDNRKLETEKGRLDADYQEKLELLTRNNKDDKMNGNEIQNLEDKLQACDEAIQQMKTEMEKTREALRDGAKLQERWKAITTRTRELSELCETTRSMIEAEGDIVKNCGMQDDLSDKIKGKIDTIRQIADKREEYLKGTKQ